MQFTMGKMLNSNHLNRKAGLLFLAIGCLNCTAFSQQPEIEISCTSEIVEAYVDRPGDLYIQFINEHFLKYSKEGKLLQQFKPKEAPTVFEPRDGSRAFTYYQKRNLAGFSSFGTEPSTPLSEEFAIEPGLACSSGDLGMWVLDQADNSLKRINLSQYKVEIEFQLPAELKGTIRQMREYQGYLFLLGGQTRLFVFSGMGKLLKSFEGKEIRFFNFIGEELYYNDMDALRFYDLFDGTQRQEQAEPGARFILLTDEARFVVYRDKVAIFRIN